MSVLSMMSSINVELLTAINSIFLICLLLFLLRTFKEVGLQIYICLALVVANIQVMKGTNFFFTSEPVPLGTITYGTISIALSIITELYGANIAKKTIWLGTIFSCGFVICMLFTIGYQPLQETNLPQELRFLYDNHFAMKQLFTPIVSILIAGLIAYFISERSLVYIQTVMRKIIQSAQIRTYIANLIAAFIDLFIMNFLAWVVFSEHPITMKQLFISYILASYPFRLFTSIVAIPTMKVVQYMKLKN